jgi:hypothetical protein
MRAVQSIPLRALGLAACAAALLLADAASAQRTQFRLRLLGNNADAVSEFRPRLVDGVVVWQRGTGAGSEVMLWDGVASQSLTFNGVADQNPETDGIHVVWEQSTGSQFDVAIYDLVTGTLTFLSSPSSDRFPQISGTTLTWVRDDGADGELFVDNGPLELQLSGDDLVDSMFDAEGGHVVFSRSDDLDLTADPSDDDGDILLWNDTVQGIFGLGGLDTDDIRPSIGGEWVVWQAGPDGDADIWYGNIFGFAAALYDGDDDRNPDTDGDRVVWQHWDGIDFDIFAVSLSNPSSTLQVTTDSTDDTTPRVDGPHIIWSKQEEPGDAAIWVSWNGRPPEPVEPTQGNGRDDVRPRIDGEEFVFESCRNLGQPNEICDVVLPEPGAIATALAALATLAGVRRMRRIDPC